MIVGILGGGQLARMLALAGHPLGIRCIVIDPAEDACARDVATHWVGAYDDTALLERLAREAEVVTYEFENVALSSVRYLSERLRVHPSQRALEASSDRLLEKSLFVELGVPTTPFRPVNSSDELRIALDAIGAPAVLKTRREGYDGKGQRVIRTGDDVDRAWSSMPDGPKILERFVTFEREVSAIAVRTARGEVAHYAVSENVHRDGILRKATAQADDPMAALARQYVTRLMGALDYVGVVALELFVADGGLLANEFAPRVHNSGHWTIEGAETSQFENHLRAIAGLPLGNTGLLGHPAMLNFIGELPALDDLLVHGDVHVHVYGKAPRPARKIGHVTVRAGSEAMRDATLAALASLPGAG